MATQNLLGLESLETRETPSRGFAPGLSFTLPTFNVVSGTVFADANGNGTRDAGENGVNGVRVFVDVNNNGLRDANEPTAVTQSSKSISFQNGQTVTTDRPGSFFINSVVNRVAVGGPVRVELPDGAVLTTAVAGAGTNNTAQFPIGLQGVTGTPDTVTTNPTSGGSVIFLPPSGTSSSGSVSSSGSSSAFVSSVASTGPNGTFASTTGSVSGNATAFGTATATGPNGTITSVFVG